MQVWPAIDIRDGKCVRLDRANPNNEMIYGEDPADMANRWVAEGATGLHVVDLDDDDESKLPNIEWIKKIALDSDIPLRVEGNLRSIEMIEPLLELGIKRLVLSNDLRDVDQIRKLAVRYSEHLLVHIGTDSDDTDSHLSFARQLGDVPIGGIIYTNILETRSQRRPNFEAIFALNQMVNAPVTVSGGVSTTDDIKELEKNGLAGCVIGRALYESKLTLAEANRAADSGVTAS